MGELARMAPTARRQRASAPAARNPAGAQRWHPGTGNQAMLRRLQAQLKIGPVDDPLERDADAAADQVMRMPAPGHGLTATFSPPRINRVCAECAAEEETLQSKRMGADMAEQEAPAAVEKTLRAPGRPLDTGLRAFFEPRFSADLADVRVHTGPEAAKSAKAVDALAYTVGPHVVFAENRYAPGTHEGGRLLAHELAHTIQQRAVAGPGAVGESKPRPVRQVNNDQETFSPGNGPIPAAVANGGAANGGASQAGDIGDVGSPPQAGSAQSLTVDAGAGAGTCAENFQNTGTGLASKRLLGQISTYGLYINAIEIMFEFDFGSFPQLSFFRPVQWAGPESQWVKRDHPITGDWQQVSFNPVGKGPDDPTPENTFRSSNVVAFYDNPGPNLIILKNLNATGNLSRYVAKQNFTASVDGDPGPQRHVCQDIAWHSVVDLINPNWNSPDAGASWTFAPGTESGPGWVDASKPPGI